MVSWMRADRARGGSGPLHWADDFLGLALAKGHGVMILHDIAYADIGSNQVRRVTYSAGNHAPDIITAATDSSARLPPSSLAS